MKTFYLSLFLCILVSMNSQQFLSIDMLSEEDFFSFLLDGTTTTPATTPTTSAATPSTASTVVSAIDYLSKAFMGVQSKWSEIVTTFKTTRGSNIKSYTEGKGFDYFSAKTKTQVLKGVKPDDFENILVPRLIARFKVPTEQQSDLSDVLLDSMISDTNAWSETDCLFSVDTMGSTKFITLLSSRNAQGTMDLVYSDVQAELTFSPDIMVVTKSLSVLGGIWSDSKDEVTKVPKSITPDMITGVTEFLKLVAYQGIASQFGIKLDLPTL